MPVCDTQQKVCLWGYCILDAYGCDDASTILSDYVRMLASSSLVTIFLLLPEIGLHFFL